jgi:hypothetical protein
MKNLVKIHRRKLQQHSLLYNLTPVSDKQIMKYFSHLKFTNMSGVDLFDLLAVKNSYKFLETPENS